jgi:hypothetical protein
MTIFQDILAALVMVSPLHRAVVKVIIERVCGKVGRNKMEDAMMGVFVGKEPAGCSLDNLVHWKQMLAAGCSIRFGFYSLQNNLK